MASESLTVSEVGILLALMAEAREVSNPELQAGYGLRLDGASRRKLNDLKLVESEKQGRAFVHLLADGGWARCREELAAPRPNGGHKVLYALLASLNRYLDREGLALADIFQPQTAPAKASANESVAANVIAPGNDVAPPATPVADIEQRIRDAYRHLAGRPGDWVSLTTLRPLLTGTTKAEVDAGLRHLERSPRVTIAPEENQKALTSADRAAALTIGGQSNHLLAIEDV
jgi:hypothetical protein